jgi:hypothetical protein
MEKEMLNVPYASGVGILMYGRLLLRLYHVMLDIILIICLVVIVVA